MTFKTERGVSCDVLIIGGGGAGLRAAIAAASAGADVLMVSKTRIGHATNTYLSKAIIATSGWGDTSDTSGVHTADTLNGGRNLNNPEMVSRFTGAIPAETALLRDWGVEFSTVENGSPALMKIPGHTHARHLFGRNLKGSDLVIPLKRKASKSGVRFLDRLFVASLLVSDGRINGAAGISDTGDFTVITARTVVLATGGYGHIFLNTNNAPGITGDGQALALAAGVPLQDMEFVQYYPTTLGKRGTRILLYERILVQDGVVLKNSAGEDILKKNGYPVPGNVTRDQLARVIMSEILRDPEKRGCVTLDMTGLSQDAAQSLSALLPAQWSNGVRTFDVVPTAHFCMGGIVVDTSGETACPGLFAAGEVCGGAHGANRLGGNALAEVIAMGALVGKAAADRALALPGTYGSGNAATVKQHLNTLFNDQGPEPGTLTQKLKETLWFNAGIVRNSLSLNRALENVMALEHTRASVKTAGDLVRFLEFRNMRLMGELVCRAALERTESRGSHFRTDCPAENNDLWLKNIRIRKTASGLVLDQVPVA